MTFLLLLACIFLARKLWTSVNFPAGTPEEQRLRAERHAVRQQRALSLLATGFTWLMGSRLSNRKQ